jgi:hypothetical protein
MNVMKNEYGSRSQRRKWNKFAKKRQADIRINGKPRYLGTFVTEKEASEAYQKACEGIPSG